MNLARCSNAFYLCLIGWAFGCQSNIADFVVSERYLGELPVAEIIDMPDNTHVEQKFNLSKTTSLQIYAVGELIYNLADSKRRYYLKGDDIELDFFCLKNGNHIKHFNLSWVDGISIKGQVKFQKQGLEFWGRQLSDSKNSSYQVEIRIPWSTLKITEPQSIGFDISIGDNDDGYKQEGKIAWSKKGENNADSYGKILIKDSSNASKSVHTLISNKNTPVMDGDEDDFWRKSIGSHIGNVIMGIVRDKRDLDANIHSCWDNNYLYLYIDIQDSNRKVLYPNDLIEMQTFSDYGWIEDSKRKILWKMHVLNSFHVGGALKNQGIDTIVTLKAGEYVLKYISDESHSPKNWDDTPPNTFYGIKVYNAISQKRFE